jgi:hypothetical protein
VIKVWSPACGSIGRWCNFQRWPIRPLKRMLGLPPSPLLLPGHHEVHSLLCHHASLPHHRPTAMEPTHHGLKPLKPRDKPRWTFPPFKLFHVTDMKTYATQ